MERMFTLFIVMIGMMLQAVMPIIIVVLEVLFHVAFAIVQVIAKGIYYVLRALFEQISLKPKAFGLATLAAIIVLISFFSVRSLQNTFTQNNEQSSTLISPVPKQNQEQVAPISPTRTIKPTATAQIYEATAIVMSAELNVRSSPNPNSENIIGLLKRNVIIQTTGRVTTVEGNVWAEIKTATGRGWVNTKFIRYK